MLKEGPDRTVPDKSGVQSDDRGKGSLMKSLLSHTGSRPVYRVCPTHDSSKTLSERTKIVLPLLVDVREGNLRGRVPPVDRGQHRPESVPVVVESRTGYSVLVVTRHPLQNLDDLNGQELTVYPLQPKVNLDSRNTTAT